MFIEDFKVGLRCIVFIIILVVFFGVFFGVVVV